MVEILEKRLLSNEWKSQKFDSRVFVGQHVVVAVETSEVGICNDEEVTCVVFVATDFIQNTKLHRLLGFVSVSKFRNWYLSFQVHQVWTLMHQKKCIILCVLWSAQDYLSVSIRFIDGLNHVRPSVLTVAVNRCLLFRFVV